MSAGWFPTPTSSHFCLHSSWSFTRPRKPTKRKRPQVAASIKGAFGGCAFTGSATDGVGIPGSPGIPRPDLMDAPVRLIKVASASDKNPGGNGFGVDVDELRKQLESALGDEIRQHEVQMRVTPEGLVVSLREVGFFNSGQAELLDNGHATLTRIATVLGGRGFEIKSRRPHRQRAGSQFEI